MTIKEIQNKKNLNKKIVMLTAYDYPMARLADQAGVDIVLVGDSLANVVLGLESTTEVGMDEMLHHTKAVRRGLEKALLVGDMPYGSYQKDVSGAVENARRFINEAGCDAVKLEWFDGALDVTEQLVSSGIAVMGHVGLTPQTAEQLDGFKVQGKEVESAKNILKNAKALQEKGCFSVVLECIPRQLAAVITKELDIPTIGIGAGVDCDGQVLVVHDLVGLFDRYHPKFVKQYVNLNESILSGIQKYCQDVRDGQFPDHDHSFSMKSEELDKLL